MAIDTGSKNNLKTVPVEKVYFDTTQKLSSKVLLEKSFFPVNYAHRNLFSLKQIRKCKRVQTFLTKPR